MGNMKYCVFTFSDGTKASNKLIPWFKLLIRSSHREYLIVMMMMMMIKLARSLVNLLLHH